MQNEYWMDELKDINSFNNFLKDINCFKTFDKASYDFSNDIVDFEKFLKEQNVSFFEFYTSLISLYLSRTTNSNGVIFSYSNFDSEDTLFKIKYEDNISIFDFFVSVKNTIDNALDNSMENLKAFVKELYPDYCDYIFNYTIVNQTNENHIKNNINSSIIFLISEESIGVEYDINTFTRFEIESMLENIEVLLYNCLDDINQHCGDVDIVCNRQLNLLNDFSKGEEFILDDKLLPDIILEMAEKYPDNFAINDEINRITYKELADLIPSLTYTLQHDYNIGKSDKIVLYLPRSYHVPLLTVCLMRLGAVTIPVDDSYPKDYIQSIINNSSPKYIIHELDSDFDDVESIHLNDINNNETGNLVDVDVDLDDTALILYTSGSTGVPKGVELTQRNIININSNYFNHSDVPEGDSGNRMVLAKFTFVASLPIYGSLMYGLEAFIIRETTKDSIAKIVKYLKTYNCYSLSATQELGLYLYNNFDLKLANLSLAGSNLLKSDIRDDSSTVLWNAYGCTETSGSVIINKVNNDSSDFSVIGRPFGNVRVYILDDNKKQLPIGAVGELVIGGPVVTKQYFNNPEQTSKAYDEFNGERVYFTNDLAYFKPDGNIVYVGRRDDLINLNGFRIEPKGVESTISGYSDFNQVKVVVGKVNRQDHLIVYYSSDVDIDEDNLKEYLSVHLPSYMVPSFYVRMDHLPLNPNGKIDVKSLPPVELEEVAFIKPRNELEEIVVDIFERVFNQENISVYDDFIQLGGTSIIAMKIVKELADYNLSVNDLIALGTPEKIAEHIQNNTLVDLDMGRYSLDEGCPLNESQLNVYLDIVRYEKNDVYNIPFTINIPGTYSADDIKAALFNMFNVHPILKSFINVVDGIPCLKTGFNPTVDYSNEYGQYEISEFMNKPFDLNNNLSRFLLVKKDDGDFVLVCVFHHLIFDGFSSLVFKQHLFDLLEGKVLKLDEGIVKSSVYNECIVKTQEYSDAEAFYESMLCEAADVSSFLSDVGDNKAGFYSLDLYADKSDIDVLLKSLGVSENILFTGVFAYTLSRFTGDNKVLFNVLDSGRDKLSNYESIGMFVNTLPLLVDCCDKDPVSFMDDVRGLIFNVFSYNFYPFRVLAQKFNINSSILFQYQPVFDEVNDQFFNVADFEFRMFEKNNRYVVNVIYSGVLSSDTIRRFVESYNMILNQLLSVNKLSDISYISSSDLELLNTYNDTCCDLDYVDVLEAFNDNLSRNPDNMLVSYEERSYTYGEGAFIADKIASSLKDLGVEVQDNVGFLVERSELYMFCVLGILSCGGVYVPLDDNHPDERIKFMLEDTDSRVVIVSDETYNRAVDLVDEDVVLLNISDIVGGEVGRLSKLSVSYGDLACILYTSGSTGVPKGVKITRKSLINVCENYITNYGLDASDVYGLFSAISFDMSSLVICVVMCAGACLAVVPEDIRLDMLKLKEYFINHNVTHTIITTQVAKLFMENVDNTSLDILFVIGEKLGDVSSPKGYRLVDAYGPTESIAYVSAIDNSKKVDYSSVGFPHYNVKFYVLDNELRRVPVGAVGELYIGGYQLADGYLNRDEETSRAFIVNPFDDKEDYGTLYRTGDMVRFLPDGSLGIVGRCDSQLKIRGNRVELGEVESVIRDMDIVEDVTVWTVDNGGNNELVAYVVLFDDLDDMKLLDTVRDYVSKYKPDYMVPSYVVGLDVIPLTVNGKVDKGALPEVDLDVLSIGYVAPTNETEKLIVDAFELVFDQRGIGLYDDFVRLGGDSLTAIKLLAYLDGFNISAGDILSLRTPYAIAGRVMDVSFDLDVYFLDSGCPLNEAQLNVYLDIKANDKKDAYLIPLFMNFSNEYDMEDIEYALNVMFDVHPILSMCVSDDFDVPYLVQGSKPSIMFESYVDDEFIIKFLNEPFDLYDSLSRFLIVESDGGFVLYAVFHHIIFDALSVEVFKRDLNIILNGGVVEVDDSFLRVSAFNRQIARSNDYVEAEEFFDSMLVDVDDAGELLDSVLVEGHGSTLIDLGIDGELFRSFLDEHNVSLNVLFSGVFAYTLSRFVGSEKVLFNIVENGRDRFGNYDSVGMFVNTLPLLVDCKNQDVSSFMGYVSDVVYGVMRYNYYPFRLLANNYDVKSDIIFQFLPEWVMDTNGSEGNIIGNGREDLLDNKGDLIADLSVEIVQSGEDYLLSVVYSDKYSGAFIDRFVKSYKFILNGMLSVKALSDICYVSSDDLILLDEFNDTYHDLLYDDVLDAFNANLFRCPDNNLVSFNDRVYSYGEGAFIASCIAESLIDLGVEVQDKVGFLVERSELYMFCVLGILSCGGVYVPLEDKLPDERIKFMLEDTDCRVVIVNDGTYNRVNGLTNRNILNISNIINGGIDCLDSLPVVYGDLACILYTSGSTGVPKGVKITRKSLINVCEDYIVRYGLDSSDVYGLFSSIGFDMSSFIISVVLCAGACLAVVPEDIRLDMLELNEYFISHNVSHTIITTQVAKLFMESVSESSLNILFVIGEKLGEVNSPINYRLIDAYGPTESFAYVSVIDNDEKLDYSSVGFANGNVKFYILDDELRRVPFGAVGELFIGGYQLADGYLNRDDQTNEVFIPNPYDEGDYGVLYRTGDVCRFLPDGSLGIVGRCDSQLKIRGNRVELGEVESVIRDMDIVEDVTVQTFDNMGNIELIAYLVLSDDIDCVDLLDCVRGHVGECKPDYMVPSYVVGLDIIPLTVNGKVDKGALPEVDLDVLSVGYVAPVNETEKLIVDAFESVFDQKGIGLYDDFVRLGGDSITAIHVVSLLEGNGVYCSARDILNYKTPYLISQHIVKNIELTSYDAVEGVVDLLPIQSYFFNQVNLNNYTQHFVLKFNVDVDVGILQKSFDELTNIHDMLRAVYRFDGDNVIQEVLPLNMSVCDIKEHNIRDNLDENIMDLFIKSTESINVENKLMDVNLIRHNDESYLMLVIHHLIVDGVSWNILLSDLTDIYYSLLNGDNINLLRPYPYKLWVEDVKNLVNSISDSEKQYWINLNGLLDDSLIKGEGNVFAFNVDVEYDVDNLFMLSEEEYLALAISRAYKKTYGEDIIFNRESYGRDDTVANLNRTIGWFTSQYPVPVKVNNGYDDVSLMCDVYHLKKAFEDVNNLGLNYYSLIYTTEDLEFKHCPVTFNFLSTEFVFKNELLESVNHYLSENINDDGGINIEDLDSESYGVTFNVSRVEGSYIISGYYTMDNYLGDMIDVFFDTIKEELMFIANYSFDSIVCCLSEPQLGVYLDEKVHDKGTAYSAVGIFECTSDYSVDELKSAIYALIEKHPILKGRVVESDDLSLLVCDSYPEISVTSVDDYSDLVRPFNLGKCLTRFFIVDNDEGRFIVYDMHHMISDATSRTIINRELGLALNGKLDNELDLGFVNASRDSFESQFRPDYDVAYGFFREMFADIDEVSSLLDDVDGCVGRVSLPIRGVRDDILSFVQDKGITVSSFLNAVFAYTYSRFVGGSKVYYNFTENGRHEDYSRDALGMFVRTVPVLVDCGNKSVDDFLSGVSDLFLEAMSSNVYPFRLLASEFNLSNSVSFEYNYDLNDTSGVDDGVVFSDEADRVSDLLCVVNDLDDGFLVSLNHLDNVSQVTAERFVNVFKEVLVQFLDKELLSDIYYVSNDDVLLLDSYNDTKYSFEYDDILFAFNDNLVEYEDNILVGYCNRCYSHGEGAFIANKISDKLVKWGVVKQDYVALFVGRSEWYLLASLGVLTCGAIYVPIETSYPDDRIILMLKDTGARVVIVDDNSEQRMDEIISDNGLDIGILNVSSILDGGVGSSTCLNVVDVDGDDVACVLYTSGTTGTPNGVLVSRRALNNFVSWYVCETNFTSMDVYGMHCSYVFDMHAHALYSPIITGGSLYVVPEDIRLDLRVLNDYFVEHGCTHTYITSQVGKLFAESGMDTSIKLLCFGGMKLGELDAPDSMGPFESYGPSENLAISTSIFANKRIHHSSIGFFVSNVKGYVLDDERRRVPLGAVGELYLAGPQLTKGYLNNVDENNRVFFDNPFDDNEGYGCIYKTGDLVRFLPDGSLGIVGRRDGQVKIRGNRVELGEVESVIRDMDIVEDVTVWTIDNEGNNELVAYVVLFDDLDDMKLVDTVRDYVSKYKPDYMVPSYVVELDVIPLTVNGKVDKGSLPEVDLDALHAEYVAPTNETEKLIIDAFEDVFNQNGIGLYDDFVRLGGDSITAIRVISLLEKNSISCSARDILNYKTPYLIAQHIVDNIEISSYNAVEGVVDLLPIQSYFFDQVNLNNFTQHFVLRFNTDVDSDILQKSLDDLINLHDMLRAVFRFDGDNVIQDVLPLNTPVCDIKEYNIKDNFDENMRKIFIKSEKSINVENKLIDVNLIQYNNENYLMLVIHHLIVDGVSWNILLTDLTHIYYKLVKGESVDLLRPYPYKLWVEDVKGLVDGISDSEKQYWFDLNGLLDDSLIKGRSNVFAFIVGSEYDADNLLMLSEEEYLALAISRAYKKTYGEDIIFNRESYGRDESIANLNRTIGWFTSQYPVSVKVNNDYDEISLMSDVYRLKEAFKGVNNLGLNYTSLIYTTEELEFKHCPITFNFLSAEFVFKNKLFESINPDLSDNDGEINIEELDSESYGINFNVSCVYNSYIINGDYARDTYLGDKFRVFIDNIKDELSFIANY